MDSVLTRICRNGIHMLYSALIQPRLQGEDARRRERILNILLVVSTILSGALMLAATLEAQRLGEVRGVPLWILGCIVFFFGSLLWASRKGLVRGVSYLFIGAYILPISYTAYAWGSDAPIVLLAYALIIIMASVLIHTRTSLILTGLISVYIVLLSQLHTHHIVPLNHYWRLDPLAMSDVLTGVALFIAVALVAWISNREIERSLIRARASEKALMQERDLLEERVEERTQEVKQLQMEKITQQYRFIEFGRLASGFFHDLATPLNVVSLHLEKLRALHLDGLGDVSAHVERALATSRRIETFLQEIRRQLAHQETRELFSPVEEIQSVIRLFDYKARTRGVEIQLETPDVFNLYGNPLKFHQLVANLVSNAIDAYEGRVQATPLIVQITLKEHDGIVSLAVQDWGNGIATEHRPHIFEPFFTTKTCENGLGIGLAITKKIVEADFHGTIALSETAGSTLFLVRIPKLTAPRS